MKKYCLIGLGNIGSRFDFTRHNLGKDFLIWLSNFFSLSINKKDKYIFFEKNENEKNINFVIPETFMNESGIILKNIENLFDDVEDLIIIHDDLQIPFGEVSFRKEKGRGVRGHNGLRSFLENLKSNKKFSKQISEGKMPLFISIGIGRPEKEEISDFVLKKFSNEEIKSLEKIFFETKNLIENF